MMRSVFIPTDMMHEKKRQASLVRVVHLPPLLLLLLLLLPRCFSCPLPATETFPI